MIKASDFPLFAKAPASKSARTQFGALCYRGAGKKTEILLITSRDSGRWVVPKGWPKGKEDPAANVSREAWEEAGVVGKLGKSLLGFYSYSKVMDDGKAMPCVVAVYPIQVDKLSDKFPEMGQRRRKWFPSKKAASRVAEPELARLLKRFKG
ncbi:NUDIX hydrolase [Actibacterium mucosum KCTC 23349]|uniref:NUDIX hydrolase n=1 Tax=Actibacterium mucosum KCTC 23349 TaxID=1454373 RepID=A0A037ZHT7_9RHOB|nr:NUDIX hydrolase [Actibacterium mucosum KCTC 23349]